MIKKKTKCLYILVTPLSPQQRERERELKVKKKKGLSRSFAFDI